MKKSENSLGCVTGIYEPFSLQHKKVVLIFPIVPNISDHSVINDSEKIAKYRGKNQENREKIKKNRDKRGKFGKKRQKSESLFHFAPSDR